MLLLVLDTVQSVVVSRGEGGQILHGVNGLLSHRSRGWRPAGRRRWWQTLLALLLFVIEGDPPAPSRQRMRPEGPLAHVGVGKTSFSASLRTL